MPVARSLVPRAAGLAGPGVNGAGGVGPGVGGSAGAGSGAPMDMADDADDGAEADDGRSYCWCQMGSYGDMMTMSANASG